VYPRSTHAGEGYWPFALWSNGLVELMFFFLAARAPFDRGRAQPCL